MRQTVDAWFAVHRPLLQAIDAQTVPQELIARISDNLLARFKDTPLMESSAIVEQGTHARSCSR